MTSVPDLSRELLQRLPIGVALVEADGTIAWTNDRFREIFGSRRVQKVTELPGLGAADLGRSTASGRGTHRVVLPRTGGGSRTYEVGLAPLGSIDPGPVVLTAHEVARDEEEGRARVFYESFLTSTNPMEVTDANGLLVDVNPAFERTYGYSRAECVGKRPNLVRSRHTRPEIYERMWADLLDPAVGHWSGEIMNRDRRGLERPVFLTITNVRNARGETTHYVGVAADLSERRQWEASAAHGDRLASIGQLAAGVAHEINTPLANVMLVAESIRRKTTDPWVESRIATIVDQVDIAGRIVRGLLDFARRSEPNVGPLDLAAVVRAAVEFLRGKQSSDVEIVEEYPKEPVPISGDRSQLLQVLTNLLNNAYEAMEGEGRVEVAVRSIGRDAEVEVRDTGPGFPPEIAERLFEPFFTTKGPGKGTGLGLAICHGIISSHHGSITAENRPDGGAMFRIRLPLDGGRASGEPAAARTATPATKP